VGESARFRMTHECDQYFHARQCFSLADGYRKNASLINAHVAKVPSVLRITSPTSRFCGSSEKRACLLINSLRDIALQQKLMLKLGSEAHSLGSSYSRTVISRLMCETSYSRRQALSAFRELRPARARRRWAPTNRTSSSSSHCEK
jgi:hypothetical protein